MKAAAPNIYAVILQLSRSNWSDGGLGEDRLGGRLFVFLHEIVQVS
jgi:hypothetical protein